jgi:hypothetical protein
MRARPLTAILPAAVLLATAAAAAAAIDLPLGDGHVSTAPKTGYVFSCRTTFGGIGGAQAIGPWVDETGESWNRTMRLTVRGTVTKHARIYHVATLEDPYSVGCFHGTQIASRPSGPRGGP